MLWRHIERWQRSVLFFSAHELEEARDNLTMVSLEMLKLGKEVVGHPCMFLTLVLVGQCLQERQTPDGKKKGEFSSKEN